MHQVLGPYHFAAEGFADGLVAEAYSKDRSFPGHVTNEGNEDPCLTRGAWARRKKNAIRLERFDLSYRQLIVAAHFDLRSQLSEILDEVVGEGIVVVENEDHVKFQCSAREVSSLRIGLGR